MKATWNGAILAESDDTIVVDGHRYFPFHSLYLLHFRPSDTRTTCPWKGIARYYDVIVNGQVHEDAAWFYPSPSDAARHIRDHVAFWHGVNFEP